MLLTKNKYYFIVFNLVIVLASSFLLKESNKNQIPEINGLLKLGNIKRNIDGSQNYL